MAAARLSPCWMRTTTSDSTRLRRGLLVCCCSVVRALSTAEGRQPPWWQTAGEKTSAFSGTPNGLDGKAALARNRASASALMSLMSRIENPCERRDSMSSSSLVAFSTFLTTPPLFGQNAVFELRHGARFRHEATRPCRAGYEVARCCREAVPGGTASATTRPDLGAVLLLLRRGRQVAPQEGLQALARPFGTSSGSVMMALARA